MARTRKSKMEKSPQLTREAAPQPEIVQSIEGRAEENSRVTESVGDAPEANPSELVDLHRKPELCNLLEIDEAYNHFNMKSYSNEIDSYINKRVAKEGKDDSKESYKEIFEDILEQSNPPRDDIYAMVNRVKEYVELQNRLIKIAEDKEEFEKKSIEDMTSEELKKVIDGVSSI